MAVIDIDRHIVTDLAGQFSKMSKDIEHSDKVFTDIKVYLGHCEQYLSGCKCRRSKQMNPLRDVLRKKFIRLDKLYEQQKEHFSESKGLLSHIINRIDKIDTGKGRE